MYHFPKIFKGLGQLEAYIDAEEGVAFQMDNGLFWDLLGSCGHRPVEGVPAKRESSKFWVTHLRSGKVMLRNWRGTCLGPVVANTDPQTFPIQPVPYSEDPSLQFDVFFSHNKVAFRAYNGLFLARTSREVNTLEAAKFFADDSCYFLPLIGDLRPPTFEILRVVPKELPQVRYCCCHLEKQSYDNWKAIPVRHTFTLAWETMSMDSVFWIRLWGLGFPSSCTFTVEDATASVYYSEDNETTLSLTRPISERRTKEVEVPPMTKATACLDVYKFHYAVVPFTAVVRKVKPNGNVETFHEGGAWKGLVYRNFQIEVMLQRLTPS